MLPIRLDKDVRSLSEFRSRVSEFVSTVCATGHPLLITLSGRGMVIVMDVRDYEVLRVRLELLEKQADGGASAGATPAGSAAPIAPEPPRMRGAPTYNPAGY